jgi:polyisoprenyl-phosphate glycosyltransferase
MSNSTDAEDRQTVLISVVVPVYSGESFIEELYRRVRESVELITTSFELIMVDDRGPDNAWHLIKALSAKDPRVRGLQLSRNFGQHNAITAGLRASRGDWTVVMDCDLQDRPEEIPRLYAKALEGFDCVLARRVVRQDRWRKRTTSRLFYGVFSYLSNLDYDGTVGNFSIISRLVVDQMNNMQEAFRFYGGLLAWMGFSKGYIDVQHDARSRGESSYSLRKLLTLGGNVILAHSGKPLRVCLTAGLGIVVTSVLVAIWVIVRAVRYGTPVAGWPTLIVSIYFSTGAIILTLGVLGLYIDQIFSEVKHRPAFIVRERTY